MMGWNHPAGISLADVVKFVKGFVDILILSSGCQSSGALAQWDVLNIKKAFHWAIFFETVFIQLKSSEHYEESLEALDGALSVLKSEGSFPEGLAYLSAGTLIGARSLIAKHMLHSLPLSDSHLKAVLMAVVQMDLAVLSESVHDRLANYLDKLSFQSTSIAAFQDQTSEDKTTASNSDPASSMEAEMLNGCDWTKATSPELSKRLSAVSCISSLHTGLDAFSRAIGSYSMVEFVTSSLLNEQLGTEQQMAELVTWHHWKLKNLLYFLDKRTIRLLSGASIILSSPKRQWVQAFRQLSMSGEHCQKNLLERVEILLLGCIADRWNSIFKHFHSVPFNCVTTSDRFYEVHNLLYGGTQRPIQSSGKDETLSLKESSILDYLIELVGTDLHVLWLLSPALSAAAIPSWSQLFRLYVNQIEIHLRGESPALSFTACCSCYLPDHAVVLQIGRSMKIVNLLREYGVSMLSMCMASKVVDDLIISVSLHNRPAGSNSELCGLISKAQQVSNRWQMPLNLRVVLG